MSVEEELHEHAEHAHEPFDKRVAATMAVIAAALAVVTVLGHISATEELLEQQKASDQWSYYQAKSIRRYESTFARDLFGALGKQPLAEKYRANAERYGSDQKEIEAKARELELESAIHGRKAQRFHFGEVFLEIAIVLSSVAILTKRPSMWWLGIASATVGAALAISVLVR